MLLPTTQILHLILKVQVGASLPINLQLILNKQLLILEIPQLELLQNYLEIIKPQPIQTRLLIRLLQQICLIKVTNLFKITSIQPQVGLLISITKVTNLFKITPIQPQVGLLISITKVTNLFKITPIQPQVEQVGLLISIIKIVSPPRAILQLELLELGYKEHLVRIYHSQEMTFKVLLF